MENEYPKVSVADVVEIISGGTPKTTVQEYWNGDISWLSISDFNNDYRWVSNTEKYITKRGLAESATTLLNKGDIIISARGTVGVLAQLAKPMAFNQSCYGIRGKAGISETDFLYYALRQAVANMKQVAHGGVFNTITRDTFKIIQISLPSLPEQRAIARILGTLDDKIEANRHMNETLEAIARALFKSWFVDFDPVRAKAEGREPAGMDAETAALFPDSFEETELGMVPKGWRCELVGNEAQVIKGVSYRSEDLAESDTALVTLKSIKRGGGYRSDGLKQYRGEYKSDQMVCPGELVVAQTDVTQAADVIGKPALVLTDDMFKILVASLDILIVRPINGNLPQEFFYLLFLTPEFQEHIYGHTNGTTVLHLSKTGIQSYVFVRPSAQIAHVFEDAVVPIFQRIALNEQESRTLAALRDALLPKLISGEIRVGDAEQFSKKL